MFNLNQDLGESHHKYMLPTVYNRCSFLFLFFTFVAPAPQTSIIHDHPSSFADIEKTCDSPNWVWKLNGLVASATTKTLAQIVPGTCIPATCNFD